MNHNYFENSNYRLLDYIKYRDISINITEKTFNNIMKLRNLINIPMRNFYDSNNGISVGSVHNSVILGFTSCGGYLICYDIDHISYYCLNISDNDIKLSHLYCKIDLIGVSESPINELHVSITSIKNSSTVSAYIINLSNVLITYNNIDILRLYFKCKLCIDLLFQVLFNVFMYIAYENVYDFIIITLIDTDRKLIFPDNCTVFGKSIDEIINKYYRELWVCNQDYYIYWNEEYKNYIFTQSFDVNILIKCIMEKFYCKSKLLQYNVNILGPVDSFGTIQLALCLQIQTSNNETSDLAFHVNANTLVKQIRIASIKNMRKYCENLCDFKRLSKWYIILACESNSTFEYTNGLIYNLNNYTNIDIQLSSEMISHPFLPFNIYNEEIVEI